MPRELRTAECRVMIKRIGKYAENKAAVPHEEHKIQVKTVGANLFVCEISHCGEKCIDTRHLKNHMRMVHGEAKLKCTYDGCCKEYFTLQGLNSHVFRAHQDKVDCDVCGKSLSRSQLLEHKKYVHASEKLPTIKCTVEGCSKEYTRRPALNRHIAAVHQTLDCDECGKRFSKSRLKRHKKYVHGGGSKCSVVGCQKQVKGRLDDHMRMEHGQAKLKCQFEGCAAEFFSSRGLGMHTNSIHKQNT